MTVVPYKGDDKSKKEQVASMFNNISKRYDLLNHLMSLGIDVYWRKTGIKMLKAEKPKKILDIATGTGDFAIEALSLKPDEIIGVDISHGMLEVGRKKLKRLKLDDKIKLEMGDSEKLLFEDNNFDAVIVSFGVRNFENLEKGLSDMLRVLKPGGTALIIELSKPRVFPLKQVFNLYFKYLLPLIGRFISKDKAAYTYLPESVQSFPDGKDFLGILDKVGFKNTSCRPLTFGISTIYIGKK
ncbi:MAG: bifunctional demethylmenaquinone methyltransferase/2-methoxy-6-polyprenyl-1,4-benzoquinol methylase UbiE [Bacteroidota bacterium]|nr:bifunctional demethylmenaquinone methyltransferase/2-methoxy-6-polyprenyl-1,4-benzoquinol methylase UbiE [Bacteroidota bacterium]